MNPKLYLHFGAGNIGRALAGPIFSRASYRLVFVDAMPEVVAAMRQRGNYRVVVKDTLPPGAPDSFTVSDVDALDVRDADAVGAAIAQADLIGTAVGAAYLPDVLRSIAQALPLRNGRPVSLLFCENLHGLKEMAREILRRHLPQDFPIDSQVGLVETSIGKMVPIMPAEVRQRDPLEVWGEAYNKIIADRNGFIGSPPAGIEGLELKDNFQAYVERKLYIHNLGHATCACHGYLRGHRLIHEAIADDLVRHETRAAMSVSAHALALRHPMELTLEALEEHVDDLLRRFGNQALGDSIYRVGRDLPRKLAPGDRFIGALRLARETGSDIAPVCRAIAAALHFAATDPAGQPYPPDTAFLEQIAQLGLEAVLARHCALTRPQDSPAIALISTRYREIAAHG